MGTPSGVVKARTIKRKIDSERWSFDEVMSIKRTPWEPVPGIDEADITTAVRIPPDPLDSDLPVPECNEPGLIARRTRLMPKHFRQHGFTDGCAGCRAIEARMPPSNQNEVWRSRMEDILSKTIEGKDMVEGGSARLASAAQRIAERQSMDADESIAPGPPTTAGGGEPQSEEDGTSDKKRPRYGSVVDSPPSTDEAGAGAGNDQQARGTPQVQNIYASGRIGETEPRVQRGSKRSSDGDDSERIDMGREEEQTGPMNGGTSSSGRWDQGEDAAMDALSAVARVEHMEVVRRKLRCTSDVSEVYSPPRIVTVAEATGLRGGFSLDLTAPAPDGSVWDSSRHHCRRRAHELVQSQRPYLLIGRPPCTAFSNLQNLNRCRPGGNEKVDMQQRKAMVHLAFCCRLYKEQLSQGRYFLHEHPTPASSWKVKCMSGLARDPMVLTAEIDQCAYGLTSRDAEGEALAKKPTRFLTNSKALKQALSMKCQGCKRHVQLVEGRASAAQEYPKAPCRAVARGIIEQA